jgi:methionyl-tRNA formyltransferase
VTEEGPASRDGARPRGGIVFVGAVHEAEASLRALIDAGADLAALVTPTEAGASRTSGAVDLAAIAAARGIPVIRTDDLNAPGEIARMRALAPALIVVVGWTRLLGKELLSIPERGCVGFHASLLPRHRGRAPVNWAILRGETETGNTLMFLAPGADTGDIIDQRAVPIAPSDTCASVYDKVAEAGASMLRAHMHALLAGRAPRRAQDGSRASVLPKRTPEMGITDWDRPAREVHDWIRALTHPYPGAFGMLGGRRVFLWSSEPPGAGEPAGPPGAVMGGEGEAVRVGARGGSLRVLRVQDEGGPELPGAQWWARRAVSGSPARFDAVDPALARWARGEGPRPAEASKSAQAKGGAS